LPKTSKPQLYLSTGSEDIELREPLLDGTYAIEKSYTKPYAACRYCHPAIEAAIKLGKTVDTKKIQEIFVNTYDLAVSGHEHTDIKGSGSARMSIPYGVAFFGILFNTLDIFQSIG
jgi:2-methylcitrate dehydratase PrpD